VPNIIGSLPCIAWLMGRSVQGPGECKGPFRKTGGKRNIIGSILKRCVCMYQEECKWDYF
jgi:hypothetical protein